MIASGALIDPSVMYRYWLTRTWEAGNPHALWIMLNPSTADATFDDATIRSCTRLSRQAGAGGLTVVNLFALRATDPRALRGAVDPVGPYNDEHILAFASAPVDRPVIAAWGAHGRFRARDAAVTRMLREAGVKLSCYGLTQGGHPRHPLYLPTYAPLVPYPVGA